MVDKKAEAVIFSLIVIGTALLFAFALFTERTGSPTGLQVFGTEALVDACAVVNDSTSLTSDVRANGSCFTLTASNMFFNCTSFTIYGNGSGTNRFAITVANLTNVTILNCNITNFTTGILIDRSNNTFIANVQVYNATDNGINIRNYTINTTIDNSSFQSNGTGAAGDGFAIRIEGSVNATIDRTNATSNSTNAAFTFTNTNTSTIRLSRAVTTLNSGPGIALLVGSGNNSLINATGISDSGSGIIITSGTDNNITNSTGITTSSIGISVPSGSDRNNLTINTGKAVSGTGIDIAAVRNTVTGNRGISDSGTGINGGGNNNTYINNNGTSNSSTGWNVGGSDNLIVLNIGSSNLSTAASIFSTSNDVINNTFFSESGTGLDFSGTDGNVSNNTGRSNTSTGVAFSGTSGRFLQNIGESNSGTGLTAGGSTATVSNNTGRSNSSTGLSVSSTENNVTQNTGHSLTGTGFDLASGSANRLLHNIGLSNTSTGISIGASNNLLINNTGRGNSSRGLSVTGSNNNLTDNVFSNSSIGVLIDNSATNNSFSRTIVENNRQGFFLGNGSGVGTPAIENFIENGTVRNNSERGIALANSGSLLNRIRNNTISNTSIGIQIIEGTNNNTFTGNVIHNTSVALRIAEPATENIIANNTFIFNGIGIYILNDTRGQGNYLENNNVSETTNGSAVFVTSNSTAHRQFLTRIRSSVFPQNLTIVFHSLSGAGTANSSMTLQNTTNFSTETTLGSVVFINTTAVRINATDFLSLNATARVVLAGHTITVANVLFLPTSTPELCPSTRCIGVQSIFSEAHFNVTGFSTYQLNNTAAALATNTTSQLFNTSFFAASNNTGNGTFGDGLGYSLATCDVNNDNLTDHVFGAPFFTAGNGTALSNLTNAGAVYVRLGSSRPVPININLTTLANMTIVGNITNALMGRAVGCGDINNDTFDDIIVGAPGSNFTGIIFGDAVLGIRWLRQNQTNVSINSSGVDDMSITVGDFSGDTVLDLAIGQPDTGDFAGRVSIIHGRTAWPRRLNITTDSNTTLTNGAMDFYGYSVAAGDLTNNSFDDLVVGAPGNNVSGVFRAGTTYLYFGPIPTGTIATTSANASWNGTLTVGTQGNTQSMSGFSLHARGDVNNNTINDLIIGAPLSDILGTGGLVGQDAGTTYIIFGPVTSGNFGLDSANVTIFGVQASTNSSNASTGERSGFAVLARRMVDVSNDSIAEVVIGAPAAGTTDAGRVYILFGRNTWSANLNITTANVTIDGPFTQGFFGFALANGSLDASVPRSVGGLGNNERGNTLVSDALTAVDTGLPGQKVELLNANSPEAVVSSQGGGGTTPVAGVTGSGGGGRSSGVSGPVTGITSDGTSVTLTITSSPNPNSIMLMNVKISCGTPSPRNAVDVTFDSATSGEAELGFEVPILEQPIYLPEVGLYILLGTSWLQLDDVQWEGDHANVAIQDIGQFLQPTPDGRYKATFATLPTKLGKTYDGGTSIYYDDFALQSALRKAQAILNPRTFEEFRQGVNNALNECDGCVTEFDCMPCGHAGEPVAGVTEGVKGVCVHEKHPHGERCGNWHLEYPCDEEISDIPTGIPNFEGQLEDAKNICCKPEEPAEIPCKECPPVDEWSCPTYAGPVDVDGRPRRVNPGFLHRHKCEGVCLILQPEMPDPPCPCEDSNIKCDQAAAEDPSVVGSPEWDLCCTTPMPKCVTDADCNPPPDGDNPACYKWCVNGNCQQSKRDAYIGDAGCFVQGPTSDGAPGSSFSNACTLSAGQPSQDMGGGAIQGAAGSTLDTYAGWCVDCKLNCDCPPLLGMFQSLIPSAPPAVFSSGATPIGGSGAAGGAGPGQTPAGLINCFGDEETGVPPGWPTFWPPPAVPTPPPTEIPGPTPTPTPTPTPAPTPTPITDVTPGPISPPFAPRQPPTTAPPPSIAPNIPVQVVQPPFVQIPFQIPCAFSSSDSSGASITTGGESTDGLDLPAGFVRMGEYQVSCGGGSGQPFGGAISVPEGYTDITAFRVDPAGLQAQSLSPTQDPCGSSGVRAQQIGESGQTYAPVPTIVTQQAMVLPGTTTTMENSGYSITLSGTIGTARATFSTPAVEDVMLPANPSASIFGAVVDVTFDSMISGEAELDFDVPIPESIDLTTVGLYGMLGTTWRQLDDAQWEENRVTAVISDIGPFLQPTADGQYRARFATIGIVAPLATKLEKIYDGGTLSPRNAIILVHGITTDALRFQFLIDDFVQTRQPFQLWTFSYPLSKAPDEIGKELSSQLEQHSSEFDVVHFITHSMGGIVAQIATKDAEDNGYSWARKEDKKIMAGQPGLGSPTALVYGQLFAAILNLKTTAMLFSKDSPMLQTAVDGLQVQRAEGVEHFIIAGDQPYAFTLDAFTKDGVVETNDGIISTRSARTVGGEEITDTCQDYWKNQPPGLLTGRQVQELLPDAGWGGHYFEVPLTHTDLLDHWLPRRIMSRIVSRDLAQERPDLPIIGYNTMVGFGGACVPGTYILAGKPVSPDAAPDPTLCKCGNNVCDNTYENELNCPGDCAKIWSPQYLCRLAPWALYPLLLLLLLASSVYTYQAIKTHKRGMVGPALLGATGLMATLFGLMQVICSTTPPLIAYLVLAFTGAMLTFTQIHLQIHKGPPKEPKQPPRPPSKKFEIDDSSIKELERLLQKARGQ